MDYISWNVPRQSEQRQDRFFVQGNLTHFAVELAADTREEVAAVAAQLEAELRAAGLGTIILSFGAQIKTACGICAKPHWACSRTYPETPNRWP